MNAPLHPSILNKTVDMVVNLAGNEQLILVEAKYINFAGELEILSLRVPDQRGNNIDVSWMFSESMLEKLKEELV